MPQTLDLGERIELVSMDPHFHDISIGLYRQDDGGPAYAYGARTRWIVFAVSAWLPYLYWGFVVWRGDFSRVASPFLIGTTLISAVGLFAAARAHQPEPPRSD